MPLTTRARVLGCPVDVVDMDAAVRRLVELAEGPVPPEAAIVVTLNPEILMRARREPDFLAIPASARRLLAWWLLRSARAGRNAFCATICGPCAHASGSVLEGPWTTSPAQLAAPQPPCAAPAWSGGGGWGSTPAAAAASSCCPSSGSSSAVRCAGDQRRHPCFQRASAHPGDPGARPGVLRRRRRGVRGHRRR